MAMMSIHGVEMMVCAIAVAIDQNPLSRLAQKTSVGRSGVGASVGMMRR